MSLTLVDALWLLTNGETPHQAAARLGITHASLVRLLHRHGYTLESARKITYV